MSMGGGAGRRVALVTTAGQRGGAERIIELLADRLPAHGIAPVVAAPEGSPVCESWRREGREVCDLPETPRLRRLDHGVTAVREIGRRLQAADVRIIHTHGVSAQLHAGMAARRLVRPVVHHVHDLFHAGWSADGLLQRLALRVRAAHTIAISATVAASLRGRVPAQTLHTIHDGVEHEISESAEAARAQDPLVVWCGRLQHWKGAHLFVDAARVVHAARPEVRFAVVGGTLFGLEPDYAAALHARVRAAGLGDVLTFVGHVADPRGWMRAARVCIHSSERPEPFGLVMVEAMMQERPVAAFAHGGAAEIVRDGHTGRLTPPGNVDALARSIIALLDDPATASAMGRAGRERALQYFDADVMTASVAGVYDLIPDHG